MKHDFQKFKTIRHFGREIYSDVITLNNTLAEQINLNDWINKFQKSTKSEKPSKKGKTVTFENAKRLPKGKT